MSLRAHYDAVAAMLRAGLPPSWTVYEWDVPEIPTYPYVRLWGSIGRESSESLAGTPDTLELRPKLTYAGLTGAQLLELVSRTRALLTHKRPVVVGWVPSRLVQQSLVDAQPDRDVVVPGTRQHPVFCVDEFPFTSQRA